MFCVCVVDPTLIRRRSRWPRGNQCSVGVARRCTTMPMWLSTIAMVHWRGRASSAAIKVCIIVSRKPQFAHVSLAHSWKHWPARETNGVICVAPVDTGTSSTLGHEICFTTFGLFFFKKGKTHFISLLIIIFIHSIKVIFCVDVSGSMSVTTEVKNGLDVFDDNGNLTNRKHVSRLDVMKRNYIQ